MSEEMMRLVAQLNLETENSTQLKEMNSDLAKQIARLQTASETHKV